MNLESLMPLNQPTGTTLVTCCDHEACLPLFAVVLHDTEPWSEAS